MIEKVHLEELYDIGSSKRVFQSEWRDRGIPFYRAREIAKLAADGYVNNELFIDEELYKEYIGKYGKPKSGDIMVTGVGTLGVCYIVKDNDEFYFKDGNILWFRQKAKNKVISEYVVKAFNSRAIKEQIQKNSSGTTVGTFTIQTAKKVELELPSVEEQSKIVSILGRLEKIIDRRKNQLDSLDNLIKSRFTEMFGDPKDDKSAFNKIPLGDLCTIVRGGSPRPIENFLGGNIPWIKIGDSTQGDDIYLHSTKEHIIEEGIKKSRYIKKGSMIFANCGVSLGFARIITFDGCIHDGWLAFQDIDRRLNEVFLLKSLNMCTDYFRRTAPDGTQPNLNTGIMKSYLQIVPPINLQKDFVRFCEKVDKLKFTI